MEEEEEEEEEEDERNISTHDEPCATLVSLSVGVRIVYLVRRQCGCSLLMTLENQPQIVATH